MPEPVMLAIDTSTLRGGVALGLPSGEILGASYEGDADHAEKVVPAMDRLVREAGLTPASIEVVGVTLGPGSFTGVRVGLSVAKALVLARGVQLVAVSSLELLAEPLFLSSEGHPAGLICSTLDAKRGESFVGLVDRSGLVGDPVLVPTPGLDAWVAGHAQMDREGQAGHVAHVVRDAWPDVRALIRLVRRRYAAGGVVHRDDVARLEPLYVRPPDATPFQPTLA